MSEREATESTAYHLFCVVGFNAVGLQVSAKLGEMLVPGHLIDRIINHKPPGITDRVYNKYDYLKEKREALDAWGVLVARIVSGLELVEVFSPLKG